MMSFDPSWQWIRITGALSEDVFRSILAIDTYNRGIFRFSALLFSPHDPLNDSR